MEQLAQFTDVSEIETGQMVYFAKQGVIALVGAINTQNKTFNVTDNYSVVGPVGPVGPAGPKGDTGATKICHNLYCSAGTITAWFALQFIDDSETDYTNTEAIYNWLSTNIHQNQAYPCTGIKTKGNTPCPILGILWSAQNLKIKYIDMSGETPSETSENISLTLTVVDDKT